MISSTYWLVFYSLIVQVLAVEFYEPVRQGSREDRAVFISLQLRDADNPNHEDRTQGLLVESCSLLD